MLPFALSERRHRLSLDVTQPFIVIAGASGSGKTTILQIWVEELRVAQLATVVVDPSGCFPTGDYPWLKRLETLDDIEAHVSFLETEWQRRRDLLSAAGAKTFLEVDGLEPVITIFDESQDVFDVETVAEKTADGERLRRLVRRLNTLHRRQRKMGLCSVVSFTTGAKSQVALKWTNATVKVCCYLEESESKAFLGGNDARAFDQTLRDGRFLMLSPQTIGWTYGRTYHRPP